MAATAIKGLMIFTDGWQSGNEIHETINYRYDQIWKITIVLKSSYDLVHEPGLKFMSSRNLVPIPIRDKSPLVGDFRPYTNIHKHSRQSGKFFVHNTIHAHIHTHIHTKIHVHTHKYTLIHTHTHQ